MRRLLLVWLCWAPVGAQFASFSTTYDGLTLYFTTPLSQSGTAQPNYGKAFYLDGGGARPQLIRNRDVIPFAGSPNAFTTNYYDLIGVNVSSRVNRMVVVGLRECSGLSAGLCRYPDQSILYNDLGLIQLTRDGHITLSPNGNWGLVTAVSLTNPETIHTVIDLSNHAEYLVPGSFLGNRDWQQHDIAGDGTAALAGSQEIVVFRPPAQSMSLTTRGSVTSVVIDAPGTTIVWSETQGGSASLHAAVISGTRITPVDMPSAVANGFAPQISDDGRRLLFLSSPAAVDLPQAFIMRPDGSARTQITREPEGIVSAVLSGNGQVAWVLTGRGRVRQLFIDSAQSYEAIGPVAAFQLPQFTPGTSIRPSISGPLGSAVSVAASVAAYQNVEVEVSGIRAPVVSVDRGIVSFQTPWDVPLNQDLPVVLRSPGDSGWTGASARLRGQNFAPFFLRTPGADYAWAAHQNWDSAVTPQFPARPGEVVHLWGTGLGPVIPSVATGVPAPVSPLSMTSTPMLCFLQPDPAVLEMPVPVLYSGLAPQTIGYYQVDVQLPGQLKAGIATLSCDLPGWSEGYSRFIVPLPVTPEPSPR